MHKPETARWPEGGSSIVDDVECRSDGGTVLISTDSI